MQYYYRCLTELSACDLIEYLTQRGHIAIRDKRTVVTDYELSHCDTAIKCATGAILVKNVK